MVNEQGINQYQEIVGKVFRRNTVPYNGNTNLYLTKDLESLKKTPIKDIFDGEEPHGNNTPLAIALLHPEESYFTPLIVVKDHYLDGLYQSPFIRENIVHSILGYSADFIQTKGYQAVKGMGDFNLEKAGLSENKLNRLEKWVHDAVLISKIFRSKELNETEEKYWQEGRILGAGIAKLALAGAK
ncbi:MAG: hypothetical protein WC438_04720 [Candidatus Pacearchaeota archaeon]